MADDDAPAAPVFLGELAHLVDVHTLGRGADVEVQIDVDIELARELEDAPDLRRAVAVVARRAADDARTAAQRLDQQLVGAGIVRQAFLWKDADLDVDRSVVLGDERCDRFVAAHADARVHLHLGAHARRAMQDALLERARRARAHVFDRHAFLERRHA
jgi:hypothetical protein